MHAIGTSTLPGDSFCSESSIPLELFVENDRKGITAIKSSRRVIQLIHQCQYMSMLVQVCVGGGGGAERGREEGGAW